MLSNIVACTSKTSIYKATVGRGQIHWTGQYCVEEHEFTGTFLVSMTSGSPCSSSTLMLARNSGESDPTIVVPLQVREVSTAETSGDNIFGVLRFFNCCDDAENTLAYGDMEIADFQHLAL